MTSFLQQASIFILSSVLVIGTMSPSHAVIVKDGSGTAVFWDDFESAPEVATGVGDSADADPVAQVGTWAVSENVANGPGAAEDPTRVQVTNASVPGAPEGDNYLRFERESTNFARLIGDFSEVVTGGTLHFSSMRYFDSTSEVVVNRPGDTYMEYFKVLGADDSQRVRMYTKEDEPNTEVDIVVEAFDGFPTNTGLSFNFDEWVRIDVDLDLDAQTYSVEVTDTTGTDTASGIPFHTAGNDAAALRYDVSGGGVLSYYDAVESFPIGPGDFDGDGDVDGNDFIVWQRNPSVGSLGDWQDNYGTPQPLGGGAAHLAVAAVPEPTSAVCLMIALTLVLPQRKRRN